MTYRPIQFALWLAVAGISFGLALSWPWLVLLGLLGPLVVLVAAVVWPLLR